MEKITKEIDIEFDRFNRWLNDTRINDDTYTMIYNQMYELQNKIKKLVDEKIQEKDKEYGILLADRDKLEMYWHNRLKKSHFIYIQGKSLIIGTEGAYVIKSEFKEKIESLED